MRIYRETIHARDVILTIVLLGLCGLLLLIPNRYERDQYVNSVRTRAEVIEVDNDGVEQFGIVKTGDQGLRIRVLNGKYKGEEFTATNMLMGKMELDKMFAVGDIALTVIDRHSETGKVLRANVIDHYRIHLEWLLLALFIILLLLYAGWTGMKAVVSFLFATLMIWKLLLPGFLEGYNPVLISLGIVTILTGAIIFLVGGLELKGLVAFLGALAGILLTCLLSVVFGNAFRIHGAVRPFAETLLYSGYGYLNLTGIFMSGVFLASSGAVMDIAMDISASMREIKERHPEIHAGELVLSGFRVGRAVIGTMTTTLLLAYSGGYTTMLMVFLAQGIPLVNVFNLTYVSAEILHTLVGSFGLVTVAPLTAIIGGVIYARHDRLNRGEQEAQGEPRLETTTQR